MIWSSRNLWKRCRLTVDIWKTLGGEALGAEKNIWMTREPLKASRYFSRLFLSWGDLRPPYDKSDVEKSMGGSLCLCLCLCLGCWPCFVLRINFVKHWYMVSAWQNWSLKFKMCFLGGAKPTSRWKPSFYFFSLMASWNDTLAEMFLADCH